MSWARYVFYVFLRRSRSSWALLSLVFLAVLASVTLTVTAYIYAETQAEAGLDYALATASESSLHAQVITQERPLRPASYLRLRESVEKLADERIGWLKESEHRFGRAQRMLLLTGPSQRPSFNSPLGIFRFRTGFEEETTLVEGQRPQPPIPDDPASTIEANVGAQTAREMGWRVGTTVFIVPFFDSPGEHLEVRIVGIVQPTDPRDVYWLGDLTDFHTETVDDRPVVPLLLTEEAFFQQVGASYPFFTGSFWWLLFLDSGRLSRDNVDGVRDQLELLEADINKQFVRSLVVSGLTSVIKEYEADLVLARVPLYLFTSLIVGLVLYLLFIAANLVTQTRRDEASLLRSRGAGIAQAAMHLALVEGIAAVVLAVALGPLLAYALNRYWLARSFRSEALGSGAISVDLPAQAYLLSAVVGLLGLVLFVMVAVGQTRLRPSETLKMRSTPPTTSVIHKYYLDAFVVALGALVWWQARERGGFVSSDLLGGLEIDASLLISPALMLLGAALIFLRLFPLFLRALARVSDSFDNPWPGFAVKRMARGPLLHASVATVVLAATALGILGAIFEPTLSRSRQEQALYAQGGDISIVSRGESGLYISALLETLEGAGPVSAIRRDRGRLVAGPLEADVSVLAVSPSTVADTIWFRSDFAPQDLDSIMATIDEPKPEELGIAIPSEAERIGLWISVKSPSIIPPRTMSVWARIEKAKGNLQYVLMGELPTEEGWHRLEAAIPGRSDASDDQGALSKAWMGSIFISGSLRLPVNSTIDVDDITASGPELPAGGQIIEGFENAHLWVPIPVAGQAQDMAEVAGAAARSGRLGQRLTIGQFQGLGSRGVYVATERYPLAVIGGPGFQVGQRFVLQSNQALLPIEVMETVRYFPTLYPQSEHFLLINLEPYSRFLQRYSRTLDTSPNEVWIDSGASFDGQPLHNLKASLPPTLLWKDRDAAVASALADPLATGGWRGLTILSLSTLLAVALLALVLLVLASLRLGRLDTVVARILGFSKGQLAGALTIELVLAAVSAVLAGTGVGILLGWWTLSYLDITPTGRSVVPPVLVTVDPVLFIVVYTGLALALITALGCALLIARRLQIPKVLRSGE